jgi:perosamine synthetase
MTKIKFSSNNIKPKDIKIINKIFKSGWLTHGKYTQLFEKEFRKFTKSKYALTVNSCTSALHLSCICLNLKRGDEVLVTSQTHVATAHAIEFCEAKPIFIDTKFPGGNIDENIIEKKINKKTKAIIIVHLAGKSCNLDKILKICKKHNLLIIEDCAHALGTYYNSQHVGNYGLTGCFSFYPTKQITTGEGGMLITNNKKVYLKAKKLKAFGIDKDIKERKKPGSYDVKLLGNNYRMTDFQSAMGYLQLKRYNKNLKIRKQNAAIYTKNLIKNNQLKFDEYDKKNSYFVFQIFSKKKKDILSKLEKNKIQYSVHYQKPVPMMSFYKKKYSLKQKDFKNSIKYGNQNISLPCHQDIKKKEILKICNIINEVII